MTLKEWFRKFHTRPMRIVAVFMLAAWSVFAVRSYLVVESKQITYVKQTADLLSIAVQQNNRVIAESLLETLISQGGATSAEVCNGDHQEIGANQNLTSCHSKSEFYENLIEQKITGSGTRTLRARFNILDSTSSVFFGLGFSLVLVFCGFYFIQSAQNKIKKDLFDPLLKNLLGDDPLEIKELIDLQIRIQQAQELEAQKAVTLAIQENNQQVAHDIRSPIDAINALLKMAKIPDSDLKTALDKAVKRANSVANFLLYAEKESFNKNDGFIFDIASVVQDIAVEKRALFLNGNIEVNVPQTFYAKSKLPLESLARILSNVVDNGMLACDKIRNIKINVNKNNSFLNITIEDSGRGIPTDVISRLGEKGFTQRNEKDAVGTGRGVYSAKKTLEEIGGEIKFTSMVGVGTSVLIQIPIEVMKANHDLDLILIDDEELNRMTWTLWAQTENKKIETFATAEDFLAQVDALPKQAVVFLDSDLGNGKKGQNYALAIKHLGYEKVVLATGYVNSESLNHLVGIDGVMGKNPTDAVKFMQIANFDHKTHKFDLG